MTHSHRRVVAVAGAALAALVAAIPSATAQSVTAPGQAGRSGRLDLQAQTLVVGDEPAEFVLRVTSPDDATVRVTVYADPLTTRTAVAERHRAPRRGGAAVSDIECTLAGDCREQATLTTGPAGLVTITLNDDEIGELLRRDPGALPTTIQLLDAAGTLLDELATSLVVIPPWPPHLVHLAFTATVDAPVAHRPDGTVRVELAAADHALTVLTERTDLPVTVDLAAETLDALDATSADGFKRVIDALAERPMLRTPWVHMDEEAWRAADEFARVIDGYTHADAVLTELGLPDTIPLTRLDPDATPVTLALLRSAGVSTVIVDDDHLSARTRALPAGRPLLLNDDNGDTMTALRHDDALMATLRGEDPELAAYQALTELLISAYESDSELGALLDITAVDPAALDVMLAQVGARPELDLAPVAELVDLRPARRDGALAVGQLAPTPAADLAPLASRLRAAEGTVETLADLRAPDTEAVTPLRVRLRAAVADDLRVDEAIAAVDDIADAALDEMTGVRITRGERLTLTDRHTDVPVVVDNTRTVPLNVELRLTAEKIRFPDGDLLELRLRPGPNTVVVPIETLASGDARITATVVTPGGQIELATGTVDIRSTAISGLGLVISLVALAVLGAWWFRTIRRVRRSRGAATVAPDASAEGEP